MVDIKNLGTPQVANRAFVALAIEAGIEETIQSIAGLGMDNKTLLIELKQALADSNPPLAEALNTQTLEAVLKYLATKPSAIVPARDLPEMLDEDGPASVAAAWDGGVADQLNVTFSAPPEGYVAEIYVDGVYVKDSTASPVEGWVNDNVRVEQASTVRVLFRDPEGRTTRFGMLANVTPK